MSFLILVSLSLICAAQADFRLLLLHNNDMHGRFQQTDRYCGLCSDDNNTSCYGGFARLHSEVSRLKEQAAINNRSSIFLNAGDSYQGTPFFTFYKGNITSDFTNLLTHLDVMCLGNHEFDEGIESISDFIAKSRVPIVCSNLDLTQEPSLRQPNLMRSVVLNVNGTKVGVVGYLTPSTMHMSKTGKLVILDEVSSIRAAARQLLNQGVTIVIALGHSGYDRDMVIAKEVMEVDVVVGGHSHTFLYSGKQPDIEKARGPYPTVVSQDSGKQVPVVQAYYATKYLGYLELDFDDNGNLLAFRGSPILLSGNKTQDPVILKNLQPYERNITRKIRQVCGRSEVVLDGRSCHQQECNLGNVIADAFVDYAARKFSNPLGWTVAAVAIIQPGGIRDSIDPRHTVYYNGSISLGDVMLAQPFSNNVVVLNLPGHVLLDALEYSIQWYGNTSGYYPKVLQVSGLRVFYNVNGTMGHRVVNVTVRCANCQKPSYHPIDMSQNYSVIMPDFLTDGGSGFTMFSNYTIDNILGVDYMIMCDYLAHQGVVNTTDEGRITLLHGVPSVAEGLYMSLYLVYTTVLITCTHFLKAV